MLSRFAAVLFRAVLGLGVCLGFARAQDLSQPGPYAAGERTVTVTRTDGSTFSALLYYPATSAGANAPFDGAAAPCPGITFGHGFVTQPSAYASTLRHLATWGNVVIATQTQTGLFPSHSAFANDMRSALTWLEQQHASPQSSFFNAIDTAHFGATGHSMGGGATILAAAADARIVALAPMAPAETNPSAIAAMSSVPAPARLICGTQDTIVPTASNGQLMYDAAAGPRQLLSILKAWHCGFVDTAPVGGIGCDSGALTRAQQLAIVRRHLTSFFLLHLRGDQTKWPIVWGVAVTPDPSTAVLQDPRARITPAITRLAGLAGQVIDFTLVVTNQSAQATSYTLGLDGGLWPYQLSTNQTQVLAPGQTEVVHVYGTVPTVSTYPNDRCIVSARRDLDGAVRCFARIAAGRQ